MNFKKVNNLTGWIVCGIATAVYLMTMERVTSFWDCGEFLSCAYKLEVGHSPGAPFFMILQRIFALFSGGAALTGGPSTSAAFFINSLSVFASSFSILFLFWTITHFGKKMIAGGGKPDAGQTIAIMGAGLVGALACTFSDTFWFSAVEGEVYATSSLFTAFTFWAMLKWEECADEPHADRWIVLIAFLIGLSVCVHLLNLLTIPALAMIYYFRRYKPTVMGSVVAFVIGGVVLGFIQFGIIQYIPRIASVFDRMFTNDLGMPFDTGAIVFLILLVALLVFLLLFAKKKGWYLMHTGMLCIIFVIIGYSCYFTAIIRSRADVPIDMTNPDNPMSFLDYVNREQFGQQPLFSGPYFTSVWTDLDDSKKTYAPVKDKDGKDRYEIVGTKTEPVFGKDRSTGESQSHFFPRIWDYNSGSHKNFYRSYLGLDENEDPTARDNFAFFFRYQMNWMWWRYFMWNFAGRQNDVEGQGDPERGNWISGISFVDGMRGLGNTDKMGDLSHNQAHNKLYFLPFILGIMGILYQFDRNKRDGVAVLTLFFFTGAAIGIFLNMTPLQPRERDYAFAGCTYTFTIWIGLGVLLLYEMLRRSMGNTTSAASIATAVCMLAGPVLMAKEEWDDHDRSRKTLANATAYNTLACCAPNAVLFTYGDNQTYPLWYIQEIEGFRKDVRVINTSLLGIDWYIDQLNYRVNDAPPVPMTWTKGDYLGDKHNYIQYYENPAVKIPKDRFFNLIDICAFMNSNEPEKMARRGDDYINYMPVKNFTVPTLSKEELVQRGLIGEVDTARVNTDMRFVFPKNAATKSDLAVMNIIAAVARDGWKRPLYFDAGLRQSDYVGTGDYMRLEGMVYRLMPFKVEDPNRPPQGVLGTINTEKCYDMFMNKFTWGGAERNDVYFDEPNRHELISYRMNAAFIASQLVAEGKREAAIKVLDKVFNNITEHSYPYGYDYSGYLLANAYYYAGDTKKAAIIVNKIMFSTEQHMNWVANLRDNSRYAMADGVTQNLSILQNLAQSAANSKDTVMANNIMQKLRNMVEKQPKIRELLEARQQSYRGAPAGGDDE